MSVFAPIALICVCVCVSGCVWKLVPQGDFPQSLLCPETDAKQRIKPSEQTATFSQQLLRFSTQSLNVLSLSLLLHCYGIKCHLMNVSVNENKQCVITRKRKKKSCTLMVIFHQGGRIRQTCLLARRFVSPPPPPALPPPLLLPLGPCEASSLGALQDAREWPQRCTSAAWVRTHHVQRLTRVFARRAVVGPAGNAPFWTSVSHLFISESRSVQGCEETTLLTWTDFTWGSERSSVHEHRGTQRKKNKYCVLATNDTHNTFQCTHVILLSLCRCCAE